MTITAQAPAGTAGREPGPCRYPGCGSPARASDAPGRPPGYCEREVPEDRDGTSVLVRHTALAAFRRRRQLAGQPDDGRPVTAAISRAGAIRDDALAAMSRLGGQLAAARLEHARAETAGHAAARHAAGLEAAEARAAAAEAVTMMEAQAAALARAEETARAAARELQDERAAHAAELAAARAAAEDAARGREQDRHQHQAALATAAGTVSTLREQLARAEAALDREREQQHETVALLHGLLASRPGSPEPKTAPRRQPAGH